MGWFLFLSDSLRYPVEFPARAFDLAPGLFPLPGIHFRRCFRQTPAGAMHDGGGHGQVEPTAQFR
jgi:hypothetical protein